MKIQEDSLNRIYQYLKSFAKEYRQQFPDFNDTMRQYTKIRGSTPFLQGRRFGTI